MSTVVMTGQLVADNSFIHAQNCVMDVVQLKGDTASDTFTYTLKGELLFNHSIVGLPGDMVPSITDGVLTLTPAADQGAVDQAIFILYKKR